MSDRIIWTTRDEARLDLAIARRRVFIPSSFVTSEFDPSQAVFESVAAVLRRLRAQTEGSGGNFAFKNVRTETPQQWDPAHFPACSIDEITTSQWSACNCVPATFKDTREDVMTPDWALWEIGEDNGTAKVSIAAGTNPEARALAECVRASFFADVDNSRGANIPLPLAFVPAPFRDVYDPDCLVLFHAGDGTVSRSADSSDGIFRVEVQFSWQAPRLLARSRIPSLNMSFPVTLE